MPKLNYRQIPSALASTTPFQGNSMSADWDSSGLYVIKSYSTVVAWFDPTINTHWVTDEHYSRTTSRHQALCRRNLPGTDAHDYRPYYVSHADCDHPATKAARAKCRRLGGPVSGKDAA